VDGTAIAWDLRKLQKNSGLVSKIDVGSAVHGVSFDYSGSYLAVCSGTLARTPPLSTSPRLLRSTAPMQRLGGLSACAAGCVHTEASVLCACRRRQGLQS
jgi:hypothetical protein